MKTLKTIFARTLIDKYGVSQIGKSFEMDGRIYITGFMGGFGYANIVLIDGQTGIVTHKVLFEGSQN